VLSAVSNFAIAVAAGRSMGASGLGEFTLAFTAYGAVLICARALISEPMAALGSRLSEVDRAATTTLTLLVAAFGSAIIATAGLLCSAPALLVAAMLLPVTLVQDVLRFQAFALARPRLAVLLDGCWLGGTLAGWPVLAAARSPAVATLVWGASAGIGLVAVAGVLGPKVISPRRAVSWWRKNTHGLAGPLLADSMFQVLTIQSVVWLLQASHGSGDLGIYRASQVYFAPIGILFTAFGSFAVPHLAKGPGKRVGARSAFLMASSLGLIATVTCAVVAVSEPVLREVLYGGAIKVPAAVLCGAATYIVVSAFGNGLLVVCKVRRRGRDIALSRALSVCVGLPLTVIAISRWGIAGAIWGTVAQNFVYVALLSLRTVRSASGLPRKISATPAIESDLSRPTELTIRETTSAQSRKIVLPSQSRARRMLSIRETHPRVSAGDR
jgi:O-antigen/teichoic acid export membrane protein